jgi:hypothetical protein
MKPHGAAALVFLLSLGSATHADLCDDTLTLGTKSDDLTLSLPGTEMPALCTRSMALTGGTQVHCAWAFPYRSPAATAAFDRLVSAVAACLGAEASVTEDLHVNHPDFYDLQTFQLKGLEIGVSLKDKAGLSETYVFLRIAVQD